MPELAVQLYTLRDDLKRDFVGTLEAVAALGVKNVELFGQYGGLEISELRAHLDRLGLSVTSGHVGLEALEAEFEAEVERLKMLGARFVVVPWWNGRDEAGWLDARRRLELVASKLGAHGMPLAYHNHAHEAEGRVGDQSVMEMLLAGEGIEGELDVAWLHAGGLSAPDFLRAHPAPLIHLKDVRRREDGKWRTVPLGEGEVPLDDCLAASPNAMYWILEQDDCDIPPLEAVKRSLDFMRARLG